MIQVQVLGTRMTTAGRGHWWSTVIAKQMQWTFKAKGDQGKRRLQLSWRNHRCFRLGVRGMWARKPVHTCLLYGSKSHRLYGTPESFLVKKEFGHK